PHQRLRRRRQARLRGAGPARGRHGRVRGPGRQGPGPPVRGPPPPHRRRRLVPRGHGPARAQRRRRLAQPGAGPDPGRDQQDRHLHRRGARGGRGLRRRPRAGPAGRRGRGRPGPPGRPGRGGGRGGPLPRAVVDEAPPWSPGPDTAVLDEALKKSTVVWVEVPGEGGTGGRAVPVWYGTLDGRVYVLVGGSEQHVPGLAEATEVVLIARSKEQ